jgi:hypothetical protein
LATAQLFERFSIQPYCKGRSLPYLVTKVTGQWL